MKTQTVKKLASMTVAGILSLSVVAAPVLARDYEYKNYNTGEYKHHKKHKKQKKHKNHQHNKHQYNEYQYNNGQYNEETYYDYAPVVHVKPLYRVVRVDSPSKHCWEEEVHGYRQSANKSYTPLILGGILGGVVGNQFGSGSGNDILTVGGALLGASIGNDHNRHSYNNQRQYTTTQTRCEVQHAYYDEERQDGYEVTYRYNGRSYVRRMKQHPGQRIRVKVDVSPNHY